MRLITAILAMLLASGNLWAAWELVSESDGMGFFIDPSSIRQEGELRKVQTMTNLKQPDRYGALSLSITHEYDCQQVRVRMPSFTYHAERMAKGETLMRSNTPAAWNDVPPDTALMTIHKKVCAK